MCSKNCPCEAPQSHASLAQMPRECRVCMAPALAALSSTAQDGPSWPELTLCPNNFHVTSQPTSCTEKLNWIITSLQASSYTTKKACEHSTAVDWNAYFPATDDKVGIAFQQLIQFCPFPQRTNQDGTALCTHTADTLLALFSNIFPTMAATAELFCTDLLLGMGGCGGEC